MLTKVALKNFQAHKSLELELGKFTTLTGGSNGGKSAVLRAINALVRNESAADYVRYGQKSLSVTLYFSDGHSIEWVKGSGDNKYLLTSPNGTVKTFDKVGSDVPEEVKEVLRLGPITIKGGDKEFVNFHSQLESPFLVSSTPGSVAKLLGELTSASQLYAAVGDGNKKVRSTNSLKSTRVSDLKALKNELENFTDLDLAEARLQESISLLDGFKAAEEAHNSVENLLGDLSKLETELSKTTSGLTILSKCCNVGLDELDSRALKITAFSNVLNTITSTFSDLEKVSTALSYLDKSMLVGINVLTIANSKVQALQELIDQSNILTSKMVINTDDIAKTESLINDIEYSLSSLFETLESCPTCGVELTDEAKSTMLSGGEVHVTH